MALTGGYYRLPKDQEGSIKDITCIKTARINGSKKLQDGEVGLLFTFLGLNILLLPFPPLLTPLPLKENAVSGTVDCKGTDTD